MKDLEYFERIEAYLGGRLDEADRAEFERALLHDAELQENLQLYRHLKKATNEPEVHDLRQKMSHWAQAVHLEGDEDKASEIAGEKTPPLTASPLRLKNRRWLAAAAAIAVLAGAVYFFNRSASKESPEALFAANFATPRTITLSGYRGTTDTAAVIRMLQEVEGLYQKKDYAGVIAVFDRIIGQTEDKGRYADEAHRGKAIACLALGRATEAEAELQKIDTGFEEDRAWYGALALLLQNEKSAQAKTVLERFAADPNFQSDRRQRAAEMAKSLE